MRILITGADGFLGSNLVPMLEGHEVTAAERFGFRANGSPAYMPPGWRAGAGDAVKPLPPTDAAIQLYALPGVASCEAEPRKANSMNVTNLLDLLVHMDGRRVVFPSSAAVERLDSFYGATKAAGEIYCRHFPNVAILRITNVFGPHSWHKSSVVASFCRAFVNGQHPRIKDGAVQRDFVWAGDVCERIVELLEAPKLIPDALYTVSPFKRTTIRDVATRLSFISTGSQLHGDYFDARLMETYQWFVDEKARQDAAVDAANLAGEVVAS
jgi:UDP-glucose 4-epimerase